MFREERNLFEVSLDVHGIDWVVVFAYFDETFGGAHNDLTAVAAYLFDGDGVRRFRELYQTTVEPMLPVDPKRGVKMFHAAPLFDRHPPFDGLERPVRECILARMADAIRESVTVGAVIGIENAEYNAGLLGRYIGIRVAGQRSNSLLPCVGSPYSLCLLRCIHGINAWLDSHGAERNSIEYVIESGSPHLQVEASTMLASLGACPLAAKYRWRKYSFVQKGPQDPWLFAPDYFAWVWQKNDRLGETGLRDEYGDWQTPILPLIASKDHIASYLTEKSVNIQALVNSVNGLMGPRGGGA